MRRGCTRRVSATWERQHANVPSPSFAFPWSCLKMGCMGPRTCCTEGARHGWDKLVRWPLPCLGPFLPPCLALLLSVPHSHSRGSRLRNGSEGMLHMTRAWCHGRLAVSGSDGGCPPSSATQRRQ